MHTLIKALIVIVLLAIVASLGSGLFHLVRHDRDSKKMVDALTLRIALSVALFIGIAVGAYSSIFVATPLYAHLREREPEMQALAKRVAKTRAKGVGTAASAPSRGRSASDSPTGASLAEPPHPSGVAVATADPAAGLSGDQSTYLDEDGVERTVTGRPVHPRAKRGPRNQPKRPPRRKR